MQALSIKLTALLFIALALTAGVSLTVASPLAGLATALSCSSWGRSSSTA